MPQNTSSQMLFKLTSKILDLFRKQNLDDVSAGIRFEASDDTWRGGYGNPFEKELPDFVKKDNVGWNYVKQSRDE